MKFNEISFTTHNSSLSAIRGLAALIVLFSHIIQIFWLRFEGLGTFLHLSSSFLSHYAVVVFFVLSGYLITLSAEHNKNKHQKFKLKDFFAARFARLYPPFILAIIISIGVYFFIDYFALPGRGRELSLFTDRYSAREYINFSASECLSAIFMSHGLLDINGPLWSLYIEAKLYIAFGCLYSFFTGNRSYILIGLFLLIILMGLRFNPEFLHYSTLWLTGCGAYYFFSRKDDVSSQGDKSILIMLMIGFIIILEYGLYFYSNIIPEFPSTWKKVFWAMVISMIIFRCSFPILWLTNLGSFSYTLYIIHFPILLLIQSLIIHFEVKTSSYVALISLASVFLVLGLSWLGRYLEVKKEPLQKMILSNSFFNKNINYI